MSEIKKLNYQDCVYIAGLFDGEGSIGLSKQMTTSNLQL